MLINTDIIIWHMRGNEKARKAISAVDQPSISIITQMELVHGLRDKVEQTALHRFLDQRDIAVLPVSESISHRALVLMEEWRLSHGLLMADALIAATAVDYGVTLLSGNHRHYSFIPSLTLKRFKP